jgi:pyruvate/2-oxoglutarate dehydrogenase complex dihydrolipoamide acyltransferase (E2) component
MTQEEHNIEATEAAQELAEQEGVDLQQIEGSGKEGRITKEDVEKAAEQQAVERIREERTEDAAALTEQEDAPESPYWRLDGLERIVYVDEKGTVHRPGEEGYVQAALGDMGRIRSGERVIARSED